MQILIPCIIMTVFIMFENETNITISLFLIQEPDLSISRFLPWLINGMGNPRREQRQCSLWSVTQFVVLVV